MGIEFILKNTLEQLNVTPYQFVEISKVRKNTIYDMINNKTKRVEMSNLESILFALNKLGKEQGLNKTFTPNDVVTWVNGE